MTNYEYSRSWDGAKYLINNPARTDGEGEQIYLAQEVTASLLGKIFKAFGNLDIFTFVFSEALSAEDKTTLDDTVTTHKNNT